LQGSRQVRTSRHGRPAHSTAPHADLVHTLTYDNGKEFAYHQTVAERLDAQGYFAHPYHSWKPGLNENTNGLIRQYLPKGADFRTLTLEKVRSIMDRLKNRPRKCLGSKTPNQLCSEINPPVALTSSIRAPKDLKSSE
jgi:IS30 family transposase